MSINPGRAQYRLKASKDELAKLKTELNSISATIPNVIGKIDARIKAKGVKTYSLDVVPAADVKDQKVVGSCEGGAKKIVYKRS